MLSMLAAESLLLSASSEKIPSASEGCEALFFWEWPTFNDQWQQKYKGSVILVQLGTMLRGHFSFRNLHAVNQGF
jgi:hypothetical protein